MGACAGNQGFLFGSGLYDITGPVGGSPTGHADLYGMILPPQITMGIHTRLYSRAFAIASSCNGKRVVFVSDDIQQMPALVRQEVLKRIAADPVLSAYYGPDNVMLSGTHTHEAGGGFEEASNPDIPDVVTQTATWLETLLISSSGFDKDNFDTIVSGTVAAIRRAHANLEAHPQAATIKLSVGELLNANVNRAQPAYAQDSPSERAQYVDDNGHEVNVDKRFVQLNFVRDDGSVVGVLNWFAVHPTAMGNHTRLISSDSKGWAGIEFERMMGTSYAPDGADGPEGADNFVAAFAQNDEGDSIPDLFVFDADVDGGNGPGQGVPYDKRFGTDDPYFDDQDGYRLGMRQATADSGIKQLAQSLKQFAEGTALRGPVDYRFFYTDFTDKAITDPVILAGLKYDDLPASLYDGDKTTCTQALGTAITNGGPNGLDPGAAGFVCANDMPNDMSQRIRFGYNGLYNGSGVLQLGHDSELSVPIPNVALIGALSTTLCLTQSQLPQYGCQAEKPVLLEYGGDPLPIQLFRIGNLAILGIPWEATTMAGRRLRKTVLDALAPAGVDTVVIAGLSNAYANYMTTREEYTAQMFEGGFTVAGPWQLAAAQQASRKLAVAMAGGEPSPDEGVGAPDLDADGAGVPTTIDSPDDFGSVAVDADAGYTQGDTVDVSFVSGYPGNDLKLGASYLYVERRNDAGGWDVVATDKDPELLFIWNSNPTLIDTYIGLSNRSTVEAKWDIPADEPAGTYRIRHDGVYRLSADADPQPYEAVSSPFTISGTPAACP
nr:neutral/alkaline non-lysosomal ceramidase N-terminal domain-containing protein [Solimonas marina]